MSKLIDLLERVGEQTLAPMGFGTASQRGGGGPTIVLIGQLTAAAATKEPGLREAEVDAFLVSLDSPGKRSLDNVSKSLSDRLWGARVGEIDAELTTQLRERGCDFIVFDADKTAGAVLNDEETGKIITIGPDLSEEVARAIHDLPIDGALFSSREELHPLTVQKLIDLQIVRGLVDKPFVMVAPPQLDSADLEAFRNAGIAGLALQMTSPEAIAETRQALDNLPRRRPGSRSRPSRAFVPQVSFGPDLVEAGPDDDEDDDF